MYVFSNYALIYLKHPDSSQGCFFVIVAQKSCLALMSKYLGIDFFIFRKLIMPKRHWRNSISILKFIETYFFIICVGFTLCNNYSC
jgi:hypothetical protein